jgi:hypothetical protein
MSRAKLTAETITDSQIQAVLRESTAAGDVAQVRICNAALYHINPRAAARDEARAECARVINDAQAQQD